MTDLTPERIDKDLVELRANLGFTGADGWANTVSSVERHIQSLRAERDSERRGREDAIASLIETEAERDKLKVQSITDFMLLRAERDTLAARVVRLEKALALHRSMVLGGENESVESKAAYDDALSHGAGKVE